MNDYYAKKRTKQKNERIALMLHTGTKNWFIFVFGLWNRLHAWRRSYKRKVHFVGRV